MIVASASLTADDVSIRCRVRRSPYARNPQFGDAQEMTCTMRNWEPTNNVVAAMTAPLTMGPIGVNSTLSNTSRNSSTTLQLLAGDNDIHHQGPELLLCPVHMPSEGSSGSLPMNQGGANGSRTSSLLSQRFHSFGSTPSATAAGRSIGMMRQRSSSYSAMGEAATPGAIAFDKQRQNSASFTSNTTTPLMTSRKKLLPPNFFSHKSAPASMLVAAARGSSNLDSVPDLANSTGSSLDDVPFLKSYAIQINDIIVVDVDAAQIGVEGADVEQFGNDKIKVTTTSNGYFEFGFHSKNSHDVLLAFLQASLPPERITTGCGWKSRAKIEKNDSDNIESVQSWMCSDAGSIDMDMFNEREVSERARVDKECWSDKIQRRFTRFAAAVTELCNCGNVSSVEPHPIPEQCIDDLDATQRATGGKSMRELFPDAFDRRDSFRQKRQPSQQSLVKPGVDAQFFSSFDQSAVRPPPVVEVRENEGSPSSRREGQRVTSEGLSLSFERESAVNVWKESEEKKLSFENEEARTPGGQQTRKNHINAAPLSTLVT